MSAVVGQENDEDVPEVEGVVPPAVASPQVSGEGLIKPGQELALGFTVCMRSHQVYVETEFISVLVSSRIPARW